MRLVVNIILLLTGLQIVLPCRADTYYMEDFCGSKITLFSKKIHQIDLQLFDTDIYGYEQYPYNTGGTCEIKIETWYNTYRKLMIYFEDFDLDCNNGHVEFFYYTETFSKVWVKGLEEKVCGEKPNGVFISPARYLYVTYVPARSQYTGRLFNAIVTAYRDDSCPSYAHQCKNHRCIDKDIACNGYNSCGDGSGCELTTGAIVGIVIGSLVVVVFIVGMILYRVYKRKEEIQSRTSQELFDSQAVTQRRNIENNVEDFSSVAGVQSPAHNASVPQSPAHNASVPQSPAHNASVPQSPAHNASVPQSPAHNASVPQSPAHNASVPATNPITEEQNSCIQDDTPPPSYSELFGNNHQSSIM